MSRLFESYLAGQLACLLEFAPMYWPTVNSYKRLVDGFWAPVKPTWGLDNRTASFRVLATSPKSTRLETRSPGADMNPYVAAAACIAAGLHGVEKNLKLTAKPIHGTNVGAENIPRAPRTLIETTRNFRTSKLARDWFGDDFVDHFAATREWEWRQQLGPERWRFKLRPGVKFHDGVPFTADDVVFSIERALHKNSQRTFQLRGILEVRKVDDLTVDFMLAAPDAVLPEKLIYIGIMSKAWSMAHGVVEPQNYNAKQETYAVRTTNGTGPYKLKSYESDVRTVLVANPDWWGRRGNVDEATYVVIQSDATRLAALVSGE